MKTPETIRPISSQQTHDLRHRILRPHQPIEDMVYPLDQTPESFHVGAFIEQQLVGVASLYPESLEGELNKGQWRLRGMAVDKEIQGRGLGKKLVQACLDYAQTKKADEVWCNARTSAIGFYLKLGFEKIGEEFIIEGIGPHYIAKIKV